MADMVYAPPPLPSFLSPQSKRHFEFAVNHCIILSLCTF